MNREVIKRYRKEFEAWLDGAVIQIENTHAWRDHDPLWVSGVKYRIKPEPLEYWIPILKDYHNNTWDTAYRSKEQLLSTCDKDELERAALFREVTE